MRFLKKITIPMVLAWVAGSLFVGTLGYHYLGKMNWEDSFLNASMILGGMGPSRHVQTHEGKIFAAFYALYSGLFLLVLLAAIVDYLLIHNMAQFKR